MPDRQPPITQTASPQTPFAVYEELQSYVDWSEEDARRLRRMRGVAERLFPELVDDFHREIERHPEAIRVLTGDTEQVVRLKRTLRLWLLDLFSGPYDVDYVARRWRLGIRRFEIGLPSLFFHAALARLRQGLLIGLEEVWPGEAAELSESLVALNMLLDLDLAIVDWAYETEALARSTSRGEV